MKHLKLFFVCLLMTLLSVGQMWADSKTFTFNTAAGLQALGISEPSANSATYLTSAISISPVTISSAKNDASNPAGVFKNSGGTAIDLRLYKYGKNGSKGSSITISVSGNYKLTGISGLWNSGSVSASTGSLSSGSWSPAANTTTTSVEIYSTATSTVSGCTVITVSYESTGGGTPEPTLSFAPFLPDPIGSIPILSRAILASSYTLYILRIYPVILKSSIFIHFCPIMVFEPFLDHFWPFWTNLPLSLSVS